MWQACGFELVFEESAEGGTEGFAVLPEHCDLSALHAALRLLRQAGPSAATPPTQRASSGASSGTASSSQPQPAPVPTAGARQPAEARPRNTQASRRKGSHEIGSLQRTDKTFPSMSTCSVCINPKGQAPAWSAFQATAANHLQDHASSWGICGAGRRRVRGSFDSYITHTAVPNSHQALHCVHGCALALELPLTLVPYISITMQVLLPTGVDAQPLPDWIFVRSPAELKAAAAAARKRQDLEQVRPIRRSHVCVRYLPAPKILRQVIYIHQLSRADKDGGDADPVT